MTFAQTVRRRRCLLSTAGVVRFRYDWSQHPPPVKLNFRVLEGFDGGSEPIVVFHGMLGSSANWLSLARIMQKRTGRTGKAIHCSMF
jgi:hypothetical protein